MRITWVTLSQDELSRDLFACAQGFGNVYWCFADMARIFCHLPPFSVGLEMVIDRAFNLMPTSWHARVIGV